jgi:uncharacterized protein RhaS with RHS repeats
MYDPTVGRFLSEDPIALLDDVNLLRYVRNSPTNKTDPTGLAAEEAPTGTKDNGYNGLGSWEFKTQEEALAFFNTLLDPKGNNFPEDWASVAKNGCVGVNLLRCGWNGLPKPRNAFFLPGAVYYTRRPTAEAKLQELAKANPDKKYLLIAAQLPTTGNGQKIANALGDVAITVKTSGLQLDLSRMEDFNFSTWFPAGYWEYMNHHWNTIDPNDCPVLKHKEDLPDMGKTFLTLYGVVEQRPWKK